MYRATRLYLGELEMAVLDFIWRSGPVDAKTAHKVLEPDRGISLNTIQSTLERLFKKKLLRREKISHAFVYRAALDRQALMGKMIDNVVSTVAKGDFEGMLGAFVGIAARGGDAHLDRLERLIAEYRHSRNKEPRS
ncbi:MAG: BlaI/MecI/CopY family transcriptional regulator [Pseudomonadota bacterium]